MIYLAVDKDGTEKISNSLLNRRKSKFRKVSLMGGLITGNYSKNDWDKWCNYWNSDKEDFLPFDGVILPKGTIEKLTGIKLTWADNPVEITKLNNYESNR